MHIKVIDNKDISNIANEWDAISPARNSLIKSGKDISFDNILVPNIVNGILDCDLNWVVDCGCGTGTLTSIIANRAKRIDGIDISKNSIKIAYENNLKRKNVKFYNTSIEEYAEDKHHRITLCIANMVFMNIIELDKTLFAINKMLKTNGILIFTITHPFYWPIYWGYANQSWFDYSKQIIMECEFSTTLSKNMGISTQIHRPLNFYINLLNIAGFQIINIKEPNIETKIDNYNDLYPRFLYIKCKKIKNSFVSK